MKAFAFIFLFFIFSEYSFAQNHGTIKVRKSKTIQGLYVLDEGDYYKTKLYLRLFDNNAAVFLRAAITPQRAKDSTAQLLYTYRKNPSVYKLLNDSVFIEGTENKIPFLYRGVAKNGSLNVRKISLSKQTKLVFKKLL
jgi:hypothetical protein